MSKEGQKVSVLLEVWAWSWARTCVSCALETLPCLGIKKSSRKKRQYLEWDVFYCYCPSKWEILLSFLMERKKQKGEELRVATFFFFCKILWLSTFLYWSYSIWEHLCDIQCVTLSMSLLSRGEFFLKVCKDKSRLIFTKRALAHARGHFQGQELEKYTQNISTKNAFFCNWDTDFPVSFRAEVSWFLVPEFASVALTDVRRTEGNPKLPTAKSVRVTQPG